MVVLAILYYLLPDVEQRFKFITPGSVVAVVIWVLASLGFSFYVSRFGSYEVSYGALGGVIILLLWMWISSLAVLLGAEINAIIEHRSPEGSARAPRTPAIRGRICPRPRRPRRRRPRAPRSRPAPRAPRAARARAATGRAPTPPAHVARSSIEGGRRRRRGARDKNTSPWAPSGI